VKILDLRFGFDLRFAHHGPISGWTLLTSLQTAWLHATGIICLCSYASSEDGNVKLGPRSITHIWSALSYWATSRVC